MGAVGDALLAPEPCPRPRPAGGPGPLGSNVRPFPRDVTSAKPRQRGGFQSALKEEGLPGSRPGRPGCMLPPMNTDTPNTTDSALARHYSLLLGLGEEWTVTRLHLNVEARRLDLFVAYAAMRIGIGRQGRRNLQLPSCRHRPRGLQARPCPRQSGRPTPPPDGGRCPCLQQRAALPSHKLLVSVFQKGARLPRRADCFSAMRSMGCVESLRPYRQT